MRNLLKYIICAGCLLFGTEIQVKAEHWQCNIYSYEQDMTLYFTLQYYNVPTTDYSDYEIAAFCGDECRGVADILEINKNDSIIKYGYLRIRSNNLTGDTISFKVFSKSTEEEFVALDSINFEAQSLMGVPSQPRILTFVSQKAVSVTANNYSRIYGDANPVFGYTSEGMQLYGEPNITCNATTTSAVGTYPIVINKGNVLNINESYNNGVLTITKAPLMVSVGEYTINEGDEIPTFIFNYEGFKNNETDEVLTAVPTATCNATTKSGIGEYEITVSGGEATNYELSYQPGKLIIIPVEFENKDENNQPAGTYTIINNNNGDDSEQRLTVVISNDTGVSGKFSIPVNVEYNGSTYTVIGIAPNTFQNNTALEDIVIPSSIESIGSYAFAGCSNLRSITIYRETPIDLSSPSSVRGIITRTDNSSVFDGVDKETCILYVPEGSVNLYKAAEVWMEFKNILPISASGIRTLMSTEGHPFNVFDLNGRKAKSKTTSVESLTKGIYIVNGKKIIIR